ncbi:MAG: TetR/AcrR family transcriptional regulator [Candidatus Nanopelagicales bacterium]
MTKSMHPTRERLLLTTVELMDSENPEKVGVEMVLEKSGISKGSLYHHFEDFPSLIEAALVYRFHHVVDSSIALIANTVATATTREEFFTDMEKVTAITHSREMTAIRFERARALGHAGTSERFKEALGVEQQRLTHAFADLVREAQSQGWVTSDIDPMAAAVFIQAYTIGKLIDEVTAEPVDEQEWLKLIHRMVERTFAP